MKKIKVFITVFILYEFLIATILQIPGYCKTFFNQGFCDVGNFKYFLMCIMLPGLLGVFFWWMPEIAQSFCKNKCQCDMHQPERKKNIAEEIISKDDLEHFINAAIILGIKKLAKSHPKTVKTFDEIIDVLKKSGGKKKKMAG